MPSILSKELSAKILGREWSFGYNCYEVGHTWTPNCTDAALEVSSAAALNILPLYAMLYTFTQVAIQRKYDLAASLETLKSVARSSFFIFFHAYNGSIMGCALRHTFGRFYYRVLVCAPALLSSYLSLVIETPARRQALAFYLLNLATEILYRMAVTKGLFRPIKCGETLLFAFSLAAWYHLLKKHGFGHDPVSAVVKVLIGREEAKSRSRTNPRPVKCAEAIICSEMNDNDGDDDDDDDNKIISKKPIGRFDKLVERWLPDHCSKRHPSCPHLNEFTCIAYALNPIPSRFAIGFAIQTLLRLSANPVKLYNSPRETLVGALASASSIRFGLFLVTLVSGGRMTSCLLRRYSDSNLPDWHAPVSGFVAGLSMLWAPRSSLSMYVMWKAVEQYYLLAHRQNKVRYFNFTILTIYSCSAATILYTFALEPQFVRPSYMKFLDNMSDHRLHQLNRMVLDVFGTGSSVGYEDYFPNLDPKYMSNQFKELVFNWMIQPYE